MGKIQDKMIKAPSFLFSQPSQHAKNGDEWLITMDDDHSYTTSSCNSSDDGEDGSVCSSSDDNDASSSKSSNGHLFELSELMAHLPIKRGLSKYYEGKSQSFASLAGVISMEDVAKKGRNHHYRRKMINCGNGLDSNNKPYTLPKPIISKKASRSFVSSSSTFPGSCRRRGGSFLTTSRPPVPPQKKI